MSTNFYLVRHEHAMGGEVSREHIGKRSVGSVFQFQARNFDSFHKWALRLAAKGAYEVIVDEYGRVYDYAQFFKEVWETLTNDKGEDQRIAATDDSRHHCVTHDSGFSFHYYEFS